METKYMDDIWKYDCRNLDGILFVIRILAIHGNFEARQWALSSSISGPVLLNVPVYRINTGIRQWFSHTATNVT